MERRTIDTKKDKDWLREFDEENRLAEEKRQAETSRQGREAVKRVIGLANDPAFSRFYKKNPEKARRYLQTLNQNAKR